MTLKEHQKLAEKMAHEWYMENLDKQKATTQQK